MWEVIQSDVRLQIAIMAALWFFVIKLVLDGDGKRI